MQYSVAAGRLHHTFANAAVDEQFCSRDELTPVVHQNSVGVYRETIRSSSDAPVAYTQIAVN